MAVREPDHGIGLHAQRQSGSSGDLLDRGRRCSGVADRDQGDRQVAGLPLQAGEDLLVRGVAHTNDDPQVLVGPGRLRVNSDDKRKDDEPGMSHRSRAYLLVRGTYVAESGR